MENENPSNEIVSKKDLTKTDSNSLDMADTSPVINKDSNIIDKPETALEIKSKPPSPEKKPLKPPKLEDKPFEEFIIKYLIPGLKSSIEKKGKIVNDIKLIEGIRPVIGGSCWMVYCELSEQRKFWLCFNKDIITSDKTILLAESNTEPSIVESFLIDEKKTTLPLLISRVLQRLNGQKWLGNN